MKLHDKILIYLFISLITVPYFLWFFADPKLKTENTLNRPFTVFPEFSSITYKQFPEQFDLWHSDHMPFRNILIRLYALTQYEILKDIENPRILFGKDGWLFYKDEHDGDPISDYKRVNLFWQSCYIFGILVYFNSLFQKYDFFNKKSRLLRLKQPALSTV